MSDERTAAEEGSSSCEWKTSWRWCAVVAYVRNLRHGEVRAHLAFPGLRLSRENPTRIWDLLVNALSGRDAWKSTHQHLTVRVLRADVDKVVNIQK